jgi:hypothetical protein
MSCIVFALPITLVLGVVASNVHASVTVFTNKVSWQSAAGPHTTIDFVGYPLGMNIANTYADLGVSFTDGQDWIWNLPEGGFPNDLWGFNGGLNNASTITFNQAIGSIAVDFPGFVKFTLLSHNQVIFESPLFMPGGYGNFRGLISDQPFDSVIIADPTGGVYVDDLHFGPPIPAPPAGVVLAFVTVWTGFGRRRSR